MYVIVLTHRYNASDVVGPFDSEQEAIHHLTKNITVEDEWSAEVVMVDDPYKDKE